MFGVNQEWRVQNSIRKYPFVYEGDLASTNSSLLLPYDVVSDMLMVIQGVDVIPKISSIHRTKTTVSILFYDSISGVDLGFSTYVVGAANYKSEIVSIGDIDVSGWVAFGHCFSFSNLTGRHDFRDTDHSIETRCYMLAGPPPVSSIKAEYGDALDGLVEFATAGSFSLDVSQQTVENETVTYVVISLIDPTKFIQDCTPANTTCECENPPIGRINSVYPDEDGNITITSSAPVEIENISGVIQISLERSSEEICVKPPVPTSDGVLPGEDE